MNPHRVSPWTIILVLLAIGFVIVVALVVHNMRTKDLAPTLNTPSTTPSTTSSNPSPKTSWPSPTTGANTETMGQATIDRMVVETTKTFPVQVNVVASGNLADGCTTITSPRIDIDQTMKQFTVTLLTSRSVDAVCTQALVPFTRSIPLSVTGLPAGTYTVVAGTQRTTFELTTNNQLDFSGDKG